MRARRVECVSVRWRRQQQQQAAYLRVRGVSSVSACGGTECGSGIVVCACVCDFAWRTPRDGVLLLLAESDLFECVRVAGR
jgi:hypothetical protein